MNLNTRADEVPKVQTDYSTPIGELQYEQGVLAYAGNTNAYTGYTTPRDYGRALWLFRQAAKTPSCRGKAAYYIGNMYFEGQGVDVDKRQGVQWWSIAADCDHPIAQFLIGSMSLGVEALAVEAGVPKDHKLAFKLLSKSAEQGYAMSQMYLGWMYQSGTGVQKNLGGAIKWYKLAAEQSKFSDTAAIAADSLAQTYDELNDATNAFEWYLKAARANIPSLTDPLNSVGLCYYTGRGALKDKVEALAWFNVAAAAGSHKGLLNRDRLEQQLGKSATLDAQKRAREIQQEIAAAKK